MFSDESSGKESSGKWSKNRILSIVLGLVLVNVVSFVIRPFIDDGNPCTARNAYNRGIALDLYGDRAAAIAAYTEYLKSHPRHVEALKNRGYDYAELGQLDPAVADMSQALQLAPNDWDLMTERAKVYAKLGQFDRAMADLTQAVQLAPDVWSTWYGRGSTSMAHGDLDAAIADYARSLAADKEHPVDAAYYPRGIAYLRAGKFDLAKADFATYAAAHLGDRNAIMGRDCAAQGSNTGDCALAFPPPTDPMNEQILNAAGRSLSGCEQR